MPGLAGAKDSRSSCLRRKLRSFRATVSFMTVFQSMVSSIFSMSAELMPEA